MSETYLTVEELDQAIEVLERLEADVNATLDQLRAAGYSEDEEAPPQI